MTTDPVARKSQIKRPTYSATDRSTGLVASGSPESSSVVWSPEKSQTSTIWPCDPEQVDTVHGISTSPRRAPKRIAAATRSPLSIWRAISSSSKVPALAAILPPIIAFTASAPSWVPENWLAPGWCHTMSGAQEAPDLGEVLGHQRIEVLLHEGDRFFICPPELGLNLLEANPY